MSKTLIVLDSSQLVEYVKCPRAWWYRYREHLAKAGQVKKALDFGSIMHALLETFYNLRAMDPKTSPDIHSKAALDLLNQQNVWKNFEITFDEWQWLQKRYIQYSLYYRSAGDFTPVVNKNGTPAVELGFSKVLKETDDYIYVVEGRIDLIATMNGLPMFVDHKTQGTKKDLYEYKPQFMTYAWATGVYRGLINYIGMTKEPTKDTFRRQSIAFPKHLIDLWVTQMIRIFDEIRENADQFAETQAYFPEYTIEEGEIFDRDLTACAGAFESNPCQFTIVCTTQDLGMKHSIKKFNFVQLKPWRPWEANE